MPKIKLFGKILLSILLISFIIEAVFLIITIREQTKNLEESLIRESTLFSQTIAKAIESGYLHFILPGKPFRELSPNILFLWIVKPNGEVYLSDIPEMLGKTIKDSSLGTEEIVIKDSIYPVRDIISNGVYSESEEKIKLIIYPLKIESEEGPWGLFVGISLKSIAAAQKRLLIIVFALFILLSVPIILAAFFLARTITKPLRQLEEGIRIIGKGNLDYRIKLKTRDEIEDLGQAFNQMTGDLKKHCIALEEERNKTLAVITNFADGLLVFDKENKLSLINPKAEDFFSVKKEKIKGKSVLGLSKLSIFKTFIAFYQKKNKQVFREELKLREDLVLEMTSVPLIEEKERFGTLVILHDITREKLIERMKSEFVSLAAHQLRTPLSTIKWILRMILDGELGSLNEEQKDFLGDGYKSNERMIALVNDLLDVTRIEEGRYIYNLTLIDIEELILEIINSYQKEIRKKGLYVEFKKPPKKPPKIMADAEKIKIAIDNIFDNAVRYSLAAGKVTIVLKYDKKEIELQIKDTGLGIPENQQKRIFTKFFRGINAVKKETEGTGLGLFIAKNIIEAHKGKIWFESNEGKGTTFYFILPIR